MKTKKTTKRLQSLGMVALALSLGSALSACGSKATLLSAHARSSHLKLNGTAPLNGPLPSPQATQAAPGTAAPAAATFAASFASVDLDLDAAQGLARLSFSHWPTPGQISTIGPMKAHLSAAVAPTGADMEAPAGVTGYTAHISCKAADCASSTTTLTKLQAPLAGTATVQIDHSAPASLSVETSGTPTGLQAQVTAALQAQGSATMQTTLSRINGGSTFFKIDCHTANGHRIVLKGTIGDHTTVSVSYYETIGDVTAGSHEDFDGSAIYSDTDQTIRMSFSGENRIHAMAFGSFRI